METTSASKRTADSDLSADTYAVCTNCSRLSLNLQNCDKCGNALSAENSEGCYSSEPKRARIETEAPSSHTAIVNGNGPSNSAPSPDTPANVHPLPVPQALYKNKNAVDDSVRPQALFSNLVTTAATPSLTVSSSSVPALLQATATTGSASSTNPPGVQPSINTILQSVARQSSALSAPALEATAPALSQAGASNFAGVLGIAPANRIPPALSMQQSSPTIAPRVSVPSYNLQPPAPPQYPLSSVQRPVDSAPTAMVANSNAAATNVAASVPKLSVEANCVSIPAQQIRIGAQKFKPITSVAFKDDGILFTLKDYTYAPVLLNARAILRCRANMNLLQYPVFLLYLEASCMKQIRNIFSLSEEDFGDTSPCELKRCITIYPAVSSESAEDVIRLKVSNELRHMFSLMEKRYMRYNKILEEMSPEEGLDVMLAPLTARNTGAVVVPPPTSASRPETRGSSRAAAANAAQPVSLPTARSAPVRPGPPPLQHSNNIGHRNANPLSAAAFPSRITNSYRTGMNSMPRHIPPISTGSAQQPVFRATNPAGPRGPPTLQIPSDPTRWQELQKSLVQGGVYHVQQASKETQYCLWNGVQLVPCLVQNTEVQLECEQVWVGSYRAKSVGHLRVKADNNAGLFVTIDSNTEGRSVVRKDLHFQINDVILCHVCIDQRMSCMFLELNNVGAEKIRSLLRISHHYDPAYHTKATEERRKHLILFLKNVNSDQWEALSSMKFSGRKSTLFVKIDVLKALKILADIKSNSQVQAKITDWINKKSLPPNLIAVEKIAQELTNPNDHQSSSAADDDDDVIMTQEEVGVKCPYTQQVMKEPMKNKICGHNYEKAAIHEFISRKKGTAKCPYAGCGNSVPLKMSDMEDNYELKEYINKNVK